MAKSWPPRSIFPPPLLNGEYVVRYFPDPSYAPVATLGAPPVVRNPDAVAFSVQESTVTAKVTLSSADPAAETVWVGVFFKTFSNQ